jgi:outer membrane protein TolC
VNKIATSVVLLIVTTAQAEPRRLDLADLLARARRAPAPRVAEASARAAHHKEDEIGLSWVPQIELLAAGGPSPEIHCMPSTVMCITTDVKDQGIAFSGLFFHVEAKATMPVFTFGKLSAGKRAAEAGANAADALAIAAAADAELDAARAYYGVKLAREILLMLQEGADDIDGAIKTVEKQLEKGTGDVTEGDRHRLRAFRAEIEARISEARHGERLGLAGVRFFTGDPEADVDAAPLAEAEAALGTAAEARARALGDRPERRAAAEGVKAAEELERVERLRWLPDIVGAAQATISRASGADDPQNAFANDPLNVTAFSAGIALRWVFDPAVRPSKILGAAADAEKARATADLATTGVAAEAERAWADASDAKDRLQASRLGEKEARAWLVSTLQATSAGLAEPKDIADALLAWFTVRARVLQALFDWDVAVVNLSRSTGQLTK